MSSRFITVPGRFLACSEIALRKAVPRILPRAGSARAPARSVGADALDPSRFVVSDALRATDSAKFAAIENDPTRVE
jgi:hypothetical protein